ncbi:MAG: IS1380 family transposase [Planctomycetes bacterium]|nr:IS1380 family transposase [Planctomycetota bacterium]
MGLKPKRSPAEGDFLFQIDPEPLEEQVTALGGVPLLVRTLRSLDVPGSVKRNLSIKQRDRGYDEATYIESFVVLNAVGGDCLDDFDRLREDPGLAGMLGHAVPSSKAAGQFLYQFHDGRKIEQAQRELPVGGVSYIPEESDPLRGLAQVNEDLVHELGRRCPDQKIATVDLDGTIIESWKREAKVAYDGRSGYQPLLAVWAETNVVLGDEFRDGNVPGNQNPLAVTKRAFRALPETIQERFFRGDAACYEEGVLTWLRNEKRADGPGGLIGFAVSARMNPSLREAIVATAPECWEVESEDSGAIKECAQVNYFPEEAAENRYREPLRYVAIRIRKKQQQLFADGSEVKYFAVATNLWDWKPKRLLEWHRGKAGTIEAVHDVIKNELGGGVMPSKYFGANAAWLRMAVISFNVLTAMKRLALPAELLAARPKRLRFLIFHTPGRLIHHARQTVLRLVRTYQRFSNWAHALALLPLPAMA